MATVNILIEDVFSNSRWFFQIKNGKKLMISVHYIAGWLLSPIKKAAKQRQDP